MVPLREGLLAHERSADLGVGRKDGAGEAVIAVHVGIKESRQFLQGELVVGAHERVLEETDDDGCERHVTAPAPADVDDETPVSHLGDPAIEGRGLHAELLREPSHGNEARRDLPGDMGILGREENFQDLHEMGRVGRTGHVAVETLLQKAVFLVGVMNMSHGSTT